MPLSPSIIKKEGKVFLAVPPSIIIFLFRHKKIDKKDVIILEQIQYLNMEKLSNPELQAYLLRRPFIFEVKDNPQLTIVEDK